MAETIKHPQWEVSLVASLFTSKISAYLDQIRDGCSFQHIAEEIRRLKDYDNQIFLILGANSDLSTDFSFSELISTCDLHDLHHKHPPPSTYIGSTHWRIDYRLGYTTLLEMCRQAGELSHFECPTSDHRGLFIDLIIPDLSPALRQQKWQQLHAERSIQEIPSWLPHILCPSGNSISSTVCNKEWNTYIEIIKQWRRQLYWNS